MKKPDIFDPSKKYVFTNWSNEDWDFKYANPEFQFIPPPDNEYTQKEVKRMWEAAYKKDYYKTIHVKAGSMVEVAEWLAFLMCKHFVDREFVKGVETKFGSLKQVNGVKNEKAESEILQMNSSSVRDQMEEKTIRPISSNEESPIIAQLREQIRGEEKAKLIKKAETELEIQATERAVVSIEVKPKRGRPKKEFADANV